MNSDAEPLVCEKCGQVHPGCKAHNNRGEPCGNQPVKGSKVCRSHGGASPRGKAAALVARTEAETAKVVSRWLKDAPPLTDPLSALLDLGRETVAFKDELRAKVDELDGVWSYWTDREWHNADGIPIRTEAVENLRATLTAYERALDRCGKILADLAKLGIEERMARVKEAQAAVVVAAVRSALDGAVDAGEIPQAAIAGVEGRIAVALRAAGRNKS